MLMHTAYIRASAILDGNNAARVLMQFHQKQPASSCGLIPHDSPRQALNFSLDEMIRVVDATNVEQSKQRLFGASRLYIDLHVCMSPSKILKP